MKKKFFTFFLSICSLVGSNFFNTEALANQISIKKDIAEEWPAHLAFLVMLGAESRIAESSVTASSTPWLTHYYPTLKSSINFGKPNPNPESLVSKGVKLVFFPSGRTGEISYWSKLGLSTYSMPIHNYHQLLDCIHKTADALNNKEASVRFSAYQQLWDQAVVDIRKKQRSNRVPPKVLHITSLQPLLIDGEDTLINEWITMAGGRNAAKGAVGNKKPVDWEQIVAWKPDIIILQSDAGNIEELKSETGKVILKTHKVVRNPSGIFLWDRYGPGSVMQIQWATDLIQDGKIDEKNWISKTKEFYKRVYRLDISESDAHLILEGKRPS